MHLQTLSRTPSAAFYCTFVDRNTPLIIAAGMCYLNQVAQGKACTHKLAVSTLLDIFCNTAYAFPVMAGRGHNRLVQQILETAVMHEGAEKAKHACINHVNKKGQSALMMACINGWVILGRYLQHAETRWLH